MPIYTKKGDTGETALPGKRRLAKTDSIFELLGTLDQTSATIGLAISQLTKADVKLMGVLIEIQKDLLSIGAAIASEDPPKLTAKLNLEKKVTVFEKLIDSWEGDMPELKNFILAGGTPAGAALHLARTISRQAERNFHRLPKELRVPSISKYLNRLSDLLFQAARHHNYLQNSPEQVWIFQNN